MSGHDDEAWLDALAGREVSGGSPLGRREGLRLRETLLAHQAAATGDNHDIATDEGADESRRRELLARARGAGLLPAAGGDAGTSGERNMQSTAGGPGRRRTLPAFALAAMLSGLALGIAWQYRAIPVDAPTRAAPGEVNRLEATDPSALQRELIEALRAAGVEARGYEQFDVHGVDADLPLPVSAELRRVLDAYGLEPAPDGVLQVEIRERR